VTIDWHLFVPLYLLVGALLVLDSWKGFKTQHPETDRRRRVFLFSICSVIWLPFIVLIWLPANIFRIVDYTWGKMMRETLRK